MRTLKSIQDEVGAWHERRFAWASAVDCLWKLNEERDEAIRAWFRIGGNFDEEIADCFVLILAAAARAGIDLETAFDRKFAKVKEKYGD